MKLVASLVVRNEAARYLEQSLAHLREFCDQIVILDDASDDGSREWLDSQADDQLIVKWQERSTFFEHEGRTRQQLLDLTLQHEPTHVLSLDGDELITDGAALRARLQANEQEPVWTLQVSEVWKATTNALFLREDGGWRTHPLPVLWRAPRHGETYRMLDRKLACRRVPMQVLSHGSPRQSGSTLLHLGWLDESTRVERHARYTRHDGGRFHASSHLRSILWPDSKVRLREMAWPEGPVFAQLCERFERAAA